MSNESSQLAESSRLPTITSQVKKVDTDTPLVSTALVEPRSRSLRARPSLPSPSIGIPLTTHSNGHMTQSKGREAISHGLRQEAVIARREKRIAEKEKELKEVVQSHDGLIREKFHLERFVTLLEGWNPEVRYSTEYFRGSWVYVASETG